MTPILQESKLVEIFVSCDDFIKSLNAYQLAHAYTGGGESLSTN